MALTTHSIIRPVSRYFRTRRMRRFADLFGVGCDTRIIDVGGGAFNWELIAERPAVLLVNVDDDEFERDNLRKVQGDGRALTYADGSFDIAYSNSVIEHVGDWTDMEAFAREIRRLAPRYYVQTPSRYFPIEPHLMAPILHWLPQGLRRALVPYLSIWGLLARPNPAEVDHFLAMTKLLDAGQLRRLFPDASIARERFLGVTKSIIAYKL